MTVPRFFRKNQERAIPTYDFFDLANNVGYKNFYVGFGTASLYPVTTNSSWRSEKAHTEGTDTIADTGFSSVLAITEDLTFNTPQVLTGDIFLNVPFFLNTATHNSRLKATVYHYDGTTPVSLGTGTSVALEQDGTNADMAFLRITLPTTVFKAGETLRIIVDLEAKYASGSGSLSGSIGHDPANRDDYKALLATGAQSFNFAAGNPTRQTWAVPFKINL